MPGKRLTKDQKMRAYRRGLKAGQDRAPYVCPYTDGRLMDQWIHGYRIGGLPPLSPVSALRFYADRDRYEYDETCVHVGDAEVDILEDRGERARRALAGITRA